MINSRTASTTLALLLSAITLTHAAAPIPLGNRRELFVDHYLVERLSSGAELRLHHPTPRDIAVTHDEPWEGNTCCYHTVFKDGDRYRMYYRGTRYPPDHLQFTCYAESRDGIHWIKPDLGLFEFNGSTSNNIVWTGDGTHNFAPFKDTNPDYAPDAAYKALGGDNNVGLLAFKSPDGIHWSLIQNEPVITKGRFDSQNLAFWDPVRKCYVDYHRGRHWGVRAIMTCTSTNFIDWTDPVYLEYPEGTPHEELYTNQILPYPRAPHIRMGFPMRFLPLRRVPGNRMPGLSDGVYMTSRDGILFHRWTEAFVRPGPQRERWVNRNNMTAWGIVETAATLPGCPNELSIYSTEGYYQGDSCAIRRFTLRQDGFVSVHASMSGGELVTKHITFTIPEGVSTNDASGILYTMDPDVDSTVTDRLTADGAADTTAIDPSSAHLGGACQLLLNYATSAAGSIRVELLDADGAPIPGKTLADCDPIYGDELERVVAWGRQTELAPYAGQPLALRFELKDADLYAIRFGAEQPSD